MRIQSFALVVVLISVVRAQGSDWPEAKEREDAAFLERPLAADDLSGEGERCYEIEECDSGLYCTGRWTKETSGSWTCATQKKAGVKAATNTWTMALDESCVDGKEICGTCGKTVGKGEKCDYTTSCEKDYVCQTAAAWTCSGVCEACPTDCTDGCHHDLRSGDAKCGRMDLTQRFWEAADDMATALKGPLSSLASCVAEVVGLRGMTKDGANAPNAQVKVGSSGKTCAERNRDTKGTCAVWKCDKDRGETYCDGTKCMCKPGYYAKDDGHCYSCTKEGIDLGTNNGKPCSEDDDCYSGYCQGSSWKSLATGSNTGTCAKADACYTQIANAKSACSAWDKSCVVKITGDCLTYNRKWTLLDEEWSIEKNEVQKEQFPNLKASVLIKAKAYGSISVAGGANIEMDFTNRKFSAYLAKDSYISANAGVEFDLQVGLTYKIPPTKQDLAPKQILFVGAFMAGPVPIFINIWCKPILIYEINGLLDVDAKVLIDYTSTLSLDEDMGVLLDGMAKAGESLVQNKFDSSKITHTKDLKTFWEVNGSAAFSLKAKLALVFSISVEGFQFQIVPGIYANVRAAADVNSHDNAACGSGGISVSTEGELGPYIQAKVDFNPLDVDNMDPSSRRRQLAVEEYEVGVGSSIKDTVKDYVKKTDLETSTKIAKGVRGLAEDYEVPDWMMDAVLEDGTYTAKQLLDKLKNIEDNAVKAAKSKIKTINLVELLTAGCSLIFDIFENVLGDHSSCKQFASYGDTICGAIKQVADAFGWNGALPVSINLLNLKWDAPALTWDTLPTCAVSWDTSQFPKNWQYKSSTSISTKVSTAKDNNIIPLQNVYIVAAVTMFAFFVIWFVRGKFQAGDNYVSTKYTVLLDEVAEEATV